MAINKYITQKRKNENSVYFENKIKEITLNGELTRLILISQLKLTGFTENRDVAAFLAFYRTETGFTVTIEIH